MVACPVEGFDGGAGDQSQDIAQVVGLLGGKGLIAQGQRGEENSSHAALWRDIIGLPPGIIGLGSFGGKFALRSVVWQVMMLPDLSEECARMRGTSSEV